MPESKPENFKPENAYRTSRGGRSILCWFECDLIEVRWSEARPRAKAYRWRCGLPGKRGKVGYAASTGEAWAAASAVLEAAWAANQDLIAAYMAAKKAEWKAELAALRG